MNKSSTNLGIWAMVATAFLWSSAGLFIKVIDWNPFAIAGARSLISSLVVLAWLRRPRFHWSLPQVGVAAILFSVAIKRIPAVFANLIAVIEPVFNPLWVFLALGEAPGLTAIAGGAIIIVAVTAASVVSARRTT
ncbi:MAG: EamA family transporter [Candidatus Aminicenantes bacterium]|nr:EamA family transporter [Candidatus Aminicenantes bacterium]